ncbi:anaphase-promoting complex subunit 1 [Leptonychotes weddellii]|uniref:Anaphase-promoting complex subunit 1 n=1 Tax=Leptonychotes weddellii TaxID=9713 RepID=A0A7F8QCJ0_LEPWE|nr:anaphase-promoting complex subunit 1 [Leptonychotes weddellii]
MSNFYEERATMIAAGDLQEFVPFGRDHCKHHPNALNLQLRQLQPASELWSSDGAAGLVGSLQEVTIHEKQKESWQLRKGVSEIGEEVDYDEELYVAGNMVIWSKGSKSQALAVYKAFTVDSPVQQALWCDFIISQDKSEKAYSSEEVEKCICILQSSCINMHSIEGKDYIASLPFQVANVWPTKYGLLFERSSSTHEVPPGPPREPLPTMFSMLHPLDEITPLVCKSGSLFGSSRVQYVVDHAMKIVFLNTDPSIIMTYDTVQCLHSVWALRRVKTEEENVVLKFSEQGGTPQNVASSSSLTAHLRSLSKGDSPVASPFQNYSSIHSQSRSTSSPSLHSRSPSISNMAALSRAHSPALGVHSFSGVQRFNLSSHNQSPKRHSVSHSPSSNSNGSFLAPETEPIVPELCIDHLWTETITNIREKNSQTSKVFITSDLCGQKFLCFLVESELQLRCVKFQESNDKTQLIFGSITNIHAKDAAPVEKIDTMLVLEGSGNLVLYTGVVRSLPLHYKFCADSIVNSGKNSTKCAYSIFSLTGGLSDLKLEPYVDHYYRDYPTLVRTTGQVCTIDQGQTGFMHHPSFFTSEPPSIYQWVSSCLKGEGMPPYPYLPGICERSRLVVLVCITYLVYLFLFKLNFMLINLSQRIIGTVAGLNEKFSPFLSSQGFTLRDLETLPFGIALPIRDAIYHCREQPASDWPEAVCLLIGRQDLSKQACEGNLPKGKSVLSSDVPSGTETEEEDDGMNDMNQEVMSLIWSEDLRVQDVRRLLQSAHPVRVNVVQYPELSDHEFIEEKENRLLQLCQRTMALPVGRGMFTLFSYHPVPTEPLPIPKLNLTGRAPPRNTTVDLNSGNIDVPPNMTSWASFHNGVAAGLKIAPASQIDSAWIVYNKPKHAELANEYAGFLMALGLNGHLTKLATLNIHDYLTKGHEMTSIGLLLGVSAAKLGTMDMSITRLLSIHIPALLPPTSTELDVPHNVQVAAVVGIGLVYQGTAHRHTAEVLLAEIGRPPGPEMEYCTDRESYSLAAGLALGMVCLGHGSNLIGMSDLNVPEQLYQYMVGGHRRFQAGMHREKHKSPSYQIKEGDTINVDVTCPGATLALAMIYLKTNNRSIADWLCAPDTMYLLDFVKPEFLLLRTLARCLILWDDILPNSKWVDSNVPQIIRENSISLSEIELPCSEDLNLETLSQAHVYIIAGACLSLGFRFAGSENLSAFNCLHKFAKDFMTYLSAPNASVTGPYNLETCLSVVLLSLAMVMAGSGNLKVLQLCRFLHMKTGGEMNYGFHLAHHMALGLLFLGGGRYLRRQNKLLQFHLCSLTAGGDMCVHAYLSGQPFEESQLSMLACFLVYHSVPAPWHLPSIGLEGSTSFAELLFKFKQLKMPVRALLRLAPLLLGSPQPMVM